MNKTFYLLVLSLFFFSFSHAQEYSFGIKGGPSYIMGGQIKGIVGGGDFGGTVDADSKFGFHGGAFFEIRFDKFLIRPEVIYSHQETEFPFPNRSSIYEVNKISVPLLLGYNVWGPVDIYAGPAFQNNLNASLQGNEQNEPVVPLDNPLAAQAGIKASFGRFEVDLRYDLTLATEEPYDINIVENPPNVGYGINRASFEDGKLSQVLLSISYKIFDSEANPGRRSGRGCYF